MATGTEYGSPAGDAPGDVVFTTAGISVSVEDFVFTTSGGSFNVARIEAATATFGTGQIANTNNINLEVDFTGLPFSPARVELRFLDMGGFENLAVNGSAPTYAGELSTAPSPMSGVAVTVATTPVPSGQTGTATFSGVVERIRVGGQEFWLDDICAYGA